MAVKHLLKTGALATLAAALAATTFSAGTLARDDNGQRGDRGGWQQNSGGSLRGDNKPSNDFRAERAARNETRESAPRVQSESSDRAPRWGSQRPPEGERYGRNWSQGGEVARPAPAFRGATPNVPERRIGQNDGLRNRSYSDPDRNTTYRDGNRDTWRDTRRDNDQWRERRDEGRYRDAYRDGRHDGWRDDRRWDRNDRRWSRDWRHDHRYDWNNYRHTHRHIYRMPRYYAPYHGYRYHRVTIGFFLDSVFFGNRYWIGDPWHYRLPPAYGPYRWVRYYDDVLLVNIYSGEVVDVIYDFFW